MNTNPLLITVTAASLMLTTCTTKAEVPFRVSPGAPFAEKKAKYDHSCYAKIPDTPTSLAYRAVLKTIPYTRKRAFYGNWAGSGCKGGRPVDAMDEIFRLHDIAYAESKSIRTMRWADESCVEALKKLDARTLSPEALEFRDRSAEFFSSRALAWVGKPVTAILRKKESKNCPFESESDLRMLFGLEEPALAAPALEPVLEATRRTREFASRPYRRGKLRSPGPLFAHLEKKLGRLKQLASR